MAGAVLWPSYVIGHAMSVDGGVVSSSPVTRFDDLLGLQSWMSAGSIGIKRMGAKGPDIT
jgi:hypothetical protein